MYIIKDKTGYILTISDDLDYQENGYPLVHNGKLAIASYLVETIEESDTIPEGWEFVDGEYRRIIDESNIPDSMKTPEQLRQEGAESLTLELIEGGIL